MRRKLFCCLLAAAFVAGAQTTPYSSQRARRAPEYLNNATIYQIWFRSFSPEGTIKAVTKKLPYIADLGATIVYLTPVNKLSNDCRPEFHSPRMKQSKAGGCKNPYRISDFDAIEPEFGTEADLRELVNEAHKLGMKVMMDVVFLHAGPDWNMIDKPGFAVRDASGKVALTQWNFTKVNFESAETRRYFIANLVHWARDVKMDGFRCDVAGGVPADFWEQARVELDKVNRDIVMLSEADVPRHQVAAFDISYNFPYYTALSAVIRDGEPATRIRKQWETARAAFPMGARFAHHSDNHDRNRADMVFGEKGALATSVLNFTLDGVPFLYNGQEIGDGAPDDILSHQPIRWDLATFPRVAPRVAFYKALFAMRKSERALGAGEMKWLENSAADSVLTFERTIGDERIVVAVNTTNRKVTATLELTPGRYTSLLPTTKDRPREVIATGANTAIPLGAFEFFVGKRSAR